MQWELLTFMDCLKMVADGKRLMVKNIIMMKMVIRFMEQRK